MVNKLRLKKIKPKKIIVIVLSVLAFTMIGGCGFESKTKDKQFTDIENEVSADNEELKTTETINTEVAGEETAANTTEPDVKEADMTEADTTEPVSSEIPSQEPKVSETLQNQEKLPADEDFVKIIDYIPSIFIDLKYSTTDNFTGKIIYDFSDGYLRYGTVKKLLLVQEKLLENGYSLKIWDAFRPVSAQFKLWEVYPDPTYVANPVTGHSSHSKGNTVDVTLVYADGSLVEMPTEFDDFSTVADRDYSEIASNLAENALILETAMIDGGFNAYQGEWWHFSDTDNYPVEEKFQP